MSAETKGLSSSPYAGSTDYSSQLSDNFGTITPPSPETVARARRVIAGHPDTDAAVTAELLDYLGIHPATEGAHP